jgi:hypothetical protein
VAWLTAIPALAPLTGIEAVTAPAASSITSTLLTLPLPT